MIYSTIASTFSGNKGAASMLEASIQQISKKDKTAVFNVFTIYPSSDLKFNLYKNVNLYSAKPLYLASVINPLSFMYWILPPIRPILRKNSAIGALANSDYLLDQGGITFVDGRTKFLIYNIATILPGLFMRLKVIKCSQAMGPFSGLNKMASKIILPKLSKVYARGDKTKEHLDTLSLNNVDESTDLAFLLEIEKKESTEAEKFINNTIIKKTKNSNIGVLPSEVVRKKTESSGQDYIAYNVEFINKLLEDGNNVVLMAYSARFNKEKRHNNDLIVCNEIAKSIKNEHFLFINDELSAQQLRYIISKMDIIVTSRFHAMIASLSVGVPSVVVGWSHKYKEIMDMFDLKSLALGSDDLDINSLVKVTKSTLKNKEQIANKITLHLPKVKENAMVQIVGILKS